MCVSKTRILRLSTSQKPQKTVKLTPVKIVQKLTLQSTKKENKESVEEYSKKYRKEYYESNKEDKLQWQKEYRERNLEYRREYDRKQSKRYYESNKDSFLEKNARRRAQKLKATPPWVDEEHTKRLRSIYRACKNVSEKSGKPHHVDHIVPLKGENVCGLHVWWNLRIVPAQENLSKGNRFELL